MSKGEGGKENHPFVPSISTVISIVLNRCPNHDCSQRTREPEIRTFAARYRDAINPMLFHAIVPIILPVRKLHPYHSRFRKQVEGAYR